MSHANEFVVPILRPSNRSSQTSLNSSAAATDSSQAKQAEIRNWKKAVERSLLSLGVDEIHHSPLFESIIHFKCPLCLKYEQFDFVSMVIENFKVLHCLIEQAQYLFTVTLQAYFDKKLSKAVTRGNAIITSSIAFSRTPELVEHT